MEVLGSQLAGWASGTGGTVETPTRTATLIPPTATPTPAALPNRTVTYCFAMNGFASTLTLKFDFAAGTVTGTLSGTRIGVVTNTCYSGSQVLETAEATVTSTFSSVLSAAIAPMGGHSRHRRTSAAPQPTPSRSRSRSRAASAKTRSRGRRLSAASVGFLAVCRPMDRSRSAQERRSGTTHNRERRESEGKPGLQTRNAGTLGETRTPNLLIRSQMLYPLSYEGTTAKVFESRLTI